MACPDSVLEALERCLAAERALGSRGPWVVAFSGGGDSTALALGLAELAEAAPRHEIAVHLFHVDHVLDSGSADRAVAAAALARQIGLPFTAERHPVEHAARRHGGVEAAAREVRYAALESFRKRIGADRILTAHHRDDQIETVLLRIAGGSGIAGLQGIHRRREAILRPLLDLEQDVLKEFVAAKGIVPLEDPTNLDLTLERNRVRHRLRPHLESKEPGLPPALIDLAAAAVLARNSLERRFEKLLVREGGASRPRLQIETLLPLPEPLAFFVLDLLERRAGREQPASTRSRRELLRQLRASPDGVLELPAGGGEGLFWRATGGVLGLDSPPPAQAPFSYILEAPGEVEIPEIGGRIRLSRQPAAAWMRSGERRRAAFAFPADRSAVGRLQVEIRSRRPGDRIRALGAPGMRRLKELLIDHKVPRAERDSLPLLVVDGTVAWVPGVTIDDRFRLRDENFPWVAEWIGNPGEGF